VAQSEIERNQIDRLCFETAEEILLVSGFHHKASASKIPLLRGLCSMQQVLKMATDEWVNCN
jgi:hypothetical protein